jgi:hypothetical protein
MLELIIISNLGFRKIRLKAEKNETSAFNLWPVLQPTYAHKKTLFWTGVNATIKEITGDESNESRKDSHYKTEFTRRHNT